MKLPYAYLMSIIKTNDLKKVIVAGLSNNKDNFKAIKRNIPKGLRVHGFKSTATVPFANAKALLKPILETELYTKPDIANLLLKGWYLSKTELAVEVKKHLDSAGYKVFEPDFNELQFTIDALSERDVKDSDDDKFFYPGGSHINGFNDEEVTIMAALLGWMVFSRERLEELQVEDDLAEKQLDEEAAKNNAPSGKKTKKPLAKFKDNIPEDLNQMRAEFEFKNQIDSLFQKFEQDFDEYTEVLNTINDKLNKHIIPDLDSLNDKNKALNAGLKELANLIGYPEPDNINDLNLLKDFYGKKLEAEHAKAKADQSQARSVLEKVLQISVISGEMPNCITKIHSLANELLAKLDEGECETNDWYALILNGTHFLNKILLAIETSVKQPENEDEIDQLVDDFHDALNEYDDSLYKPLSRLIIRNKLFFAAGTEPTPPKEKNPKKKTEEGVKERQTEEPSTSIEKKETGASSAQELSQAPDAETEEKKTTEDVKQDLETQEESVSVQRPEKSSKPKSPPKDEVQTRSTQRDKDQAETTPVVTTTTKDDKYQGFSQEDISILKLLEHDEPYLAYHLAVCYENQGKEIIVPSTLLENLALSPFLLTNTGQAAEIIAANNEKINLEGDETDKDQFKQHLLFASLLRPSIFAFNTSFAGFLLNDVSLGRYSQFAGLRNRIYEFMTQQGQEITFETIKHVITRRAHSEEIQEFKHGLKTWLGQAQNYNFNTPNHAFSQVFHNLIKPGGLIYKHATSFLESGQVRSLNNLLHFLNDGEWEPVVNAQLREIVNNTSIISNRRARTWISKQLSDLKNMLDTGVALFEEADAVKSDVTSETREFIGFLTDEMNAIKRDTNWDAYDGVLDSVSSAYLVKAVENLLDALSGNEKWVRPDLLQMKYRPLLNIGYYDAQSDWSPKTYDDDLAQSISEYAGRLPVALEDILEGHIGNGNHEAYNRILSFGDVSEDFDDKSEADQKDFIDKLGYEINKAKLKIEKGCAYGYISNGRRLDLFSMLEQAKYDKSNNFDGLNYPLHKRILDKIEQAIDNEKALAISKHEDKIVAVKDQNTKKHLSDILNDGNIIVFNDTLIRVNDGQVMDNEPGSDFFNSYFNSYLKNCKKIALDKLLEAIDKGKAYEGVDFGSIPELMVDEVKRTYKQWFTIKNNRNQTSFQEFDNYKEILAALGFIDPKCTSELAERRLVYFDFDCIALLGRDYTPLPAFGSLANGQYRLVCTKKDLNEDDLITAIKQATPKNDRAVIVLDFVWRDFVSRLEIFRLCKRQSLNFLLLDEAMMVFLMGLSGNRFPVFIQIAAPFSYKMPYQRGASNIPEEMFYGRRDEIEKLKNRTGNYSCLIYGGRQLGKTVLQKEVMRQFHSPDDNHFAVYVDLRNYGIGGYRPIDDIKDILIENFKEIPGLVPERLASNIGLDTFLDKLEPWFSKNKERRLILLLDEADQLVDQDAKADWKTILPMKMLMEKTDRRFKIVLSGLHDVRRTINIPNNPLAHFGVPICVGPMLDNDESKEAKLLVKLPLQALGYEFESDDLSLLILSHCNWYPSLIQEFCTNLLENVLIEKKQVKELPVLITQRDLATAYEKSRSRIREKFMLTLSLDERYKLLANVLAELTLDDPEKSTTGASITNIMEAALICWKDGFDNANPKIDIRNLLFEMADLGILRAVNEECFALRTPNLLEMIGSKSQIDEYLYKTEKTLPLDFKRDVSRIQYQDGEDGREKMSPFPASYYDMIIKDENKALLIRGSELSGIDSIAEFLLNKKSNFVYRIEANGEDIHEQFNKALHALDSKKAQDKKRIILFDAKLELGYDEIRVFKHKIERRERTTLLFLMKPESFWTQFSENAKSFEFIENLGTPVVNMPLWKEPVARDWFRESGSHTVNVKDLFEITGAWHYFVDKYHESVYPAPESWDIHLDEMKRKMLNNKETYLKQFGIIDDTMLKQVAFLCEYGSDKMTLDEYAELNGVVADRETCQLYVQYFRALNIIDQGFTVDHAIKNLINHG